ncbi:uncharacterized protein [Ptychodera flava]|uniref:uncharacterized protein n=1 Tax=Ptychodera flava TaxID=63121 RepID=UPI00396AA831
MLRLHHDNAIINGRGITALLYLFSIVPFCCIAWEIVRLEDECNQEPKIIDSIEGEIRFRLDRGQTVHCIATVAVPSRMHLSLTFTEFNLHASNPAMCDDTWLMIYDGPLAIGGKEMTQHPGVCGDDNDGTTLPSSLYTSENSFTVWLGRTTRKDRGFMEFRISYVVFQKYFDGDCFQCENTSLGMCIDSSLKCDRRYVHCPDGSDEDLRMCFYQTEELAKEDTGFVVALRTVDIVGITAGAVVFLVAMIVIITCFCRSSSVDVTNRPSNPCRGLSDINHGNPIGRLVCETTPCMSRAAVDTAGIERSPDRFVYQKHCRRSYNPSMMTVSQARRYQLPPHCRTQSC